MAELDTIHYPWLTVEREFVTDSGGPGQWRGAVATRVRQKAMAQMWAHTFLIGTKYTMRGIADGKDGPPNKTVIREGATEEMNVETTGYGVPLGENDVLLMEFGGGGGWGDPLKRDPKMVLEDVLDEYVSLKSAHDDYVVVINESSWRIDIKATEELRDKLSRDRPGNR